MTLELRIDTSGLEDALTKLVQQGTDIRAVVTSPSLMRQVLLYFTQQVDRGLKFIGPIKENQSRVVRGEVINGWAFNEAKRSGTRFYFRRFRRAIPDAARLAGGVALRKAQQTYRGTLRGQARTAWEKVRPAQRQLEKVWRKRASGQLYSEASLLLADTGNMRRSILGSSVSVSVGTDLIISIRSGMSSAYTDRQNELRNFYTWDDQVDPQAIAQLFESAIEGALR